MLLEATAKGISLNNLNPKPDSYYIVQSMPFLCTWYRLFWIVDQVWSTFEFRFLCVLCPPLHSSHDLPCQLSVLLPTWVLFLSIYKDVSRQIRDKGELITRLKFNRVGQIQESFWLFPALNWNSKTQHVAMHIPCCIYFCIFMNSFLADPIKWTRSAINVP